MANEKDPEIANAYDLFGDDEPPSRSVPTRPAASRPKPSPVPETFDLEGGEPEASEDPTPPVPIVPQRPKPSRSTEERRAEKKVEETHHVDEVWTRGAEWGQTLIVLAAVGFGVLFLAYLTFSVDHLSRSFLILVVGGAVWVVLTYPIVVTMERPVRITPEQAVKDYFAAASHHLPHYRRMWLLLSATGKSAPEFETFPAFRDYWKSRLKAFRGDRIKATTPITFRVEEFKAEKSAGQSFVEASYRLEIVPRGGEPGDRLDSIRFETSLVKGPDKMWYLNHGSLTPPRG